MSESARSVIASLQAQRQKFLDGLAANKGDINLEIFEDFYPDKAHFVFELLQNAEDTKATECHFKLTPRGIEFKHNGIRKFTADDVKSITGIHNSTKAKEENKIGKFGVGFKSVFIYTLTPEIHSGDFSFTIRELVMPDPIESQVNSGEWTLFKFPFNNPEKPSIEAYAEVREGLEELSQLTLLFLKNIESVSWSVDDQTSGELLRVSHSEFHIEVLKELNGKQSSSSHFLRFTSPITASSSIPAEDRQLVCIAYPLEKIQKKTKVTKFKPNQELEICDQYEITPAIPGKVSVFFPAEKENSGLRFHLHGPFVPTLDRSSIKDIEENEILYEDLARLASESLHYIKELGMLSRDFLNVLPYETDEIPPNYRIICDSIVREMNEQSLTPTYSGGHAPAKQLLQAKRNLKELLSIGDLKFLLPDKGQKQWAIGAPNNSGIDRFLKRLDVETWDASYFFEKVSNDCSSMNEEEEKYLNFIKWLEDKDTDWLQNFYALAYELLDNGFHHSFEIELDDACIVRTGSGDFTYGGQAYFGGGFIDHETTLPRVDSEIFVEGKNPQTREKAKIFLERIGVKEVDEKVEIEAILENRYYTSYKEHEQSPPSPNLEDIKKFLDYFERNRRDASIFEGVKILKNKAGEWVRGDELYIDEPFKKTGLNMFAERVESEVIGKPLSLEYLRDDINTDLLVKFCIELGAMSCLNYEKTRCANNPDALHLRSAPGNHRYDYCEDRDYTIPHFKQFFAGCPESIARILWDFMIKSATRNKNILTATYRQNSSSRAHYAPSQLVHSLRDTDWVPQTGGHSVKPAQAQRDLLPPGFRFDPSEDWIEAIQFGSELEAHKKAKQEEEEIVFKFLGLEENPDPEFLDAVKSLTKLPQEKLKEMVIQIKAAKHFELHEHEIAKPELRQRRSQDEARKAQERITVKKERSITVGHQAVKQAAKEFLRQEYTNDEGIMMCQICQSSLPFNSLADGTPYFEAVEFLPDLKKKPPKNYLALCPNHAAAFKHANPEKSMLNRFTNIADKPSMEIMLAEKSQHIYFTQRHKVDLLAIISVEEEPDDLSN